ncbi:cation transporter [Gluconobacter potus]|nr:MULTISPECIES: efflux RND transporter periplasmic adaptor subunit [Gluconobacter]OUI80331.1 cation transporter [Gluconobacter sp. DsW_056]GBR40914.1 heavy metal/cation efflux pump CzcB/HlyD [Gluconobacter kondonii NBRC 3266]KXV02983.1 cation transporter [Gluconobacter potus]TCW25542.1 cobalt-zinc-cadmium efflux system membrane fusion protein [Gluconobacter oxydans]GLQ67049.1 cation efflux system protein CzcB [Gluconobacter kondonii]
MLALPTLASAETPTWLQPVTMDGDAVQAEGLQTAILHHGSAKAEVQAMATVMEDGAHSVTIRPAGDGKVSAVSVLPGQHVRAGQPLVSYIDHTLHIVQLQLAQAKADHASAKARLADASLSYRRGQELSGMTVSRGEVARRLAALQESQNAVRYQDAAIATLTHRLEEEFTSPTEKIVEDEKSVLIAPFDGVVTQINTAVDNDIGPTDIIARLTSPTSVWIVALVRPDDAARVEVGADIRFSPLGSAEANVAKVQTVEGTADPETGLIRVVATFSDSQKTLRPGTQLTAWLPVGETVKGFVVPTSALQRVDGHMVVYRRIASDTFQPVPVKLLLEGPEQTVVAGEIKEGDDIVTKGSFTLKAMALLSGLGGD